MNCNFYWQPACFQLMTEVPTNVYLDQTSLNLASQSSFQPSYQQLKNKCTELELQNLRLKQQLNHLKVKFFFIKGKKIEQDQKDSQKTQGGIVGEKIQMSKLKLQKVICFFPGIKFAYEDQTCIKEKKRSPSKEIWSRRKDKTVKQLKANHFATINEQKSTFNFC